MEMCQDQEGMYLHHGCNPGGRDDQGDFGADYNGPRGPDWDWGFLWQQECGVQPQKSNHQGVPVDEGYVKKVEEIGDSEQIADNLSKLTGTRMDLIQTLKQGRFFH